jgi:hypothetical protein
MLSRLGAQMGSRQEEMTERTAEVASQQRPGAIFLHGRTPSAESECTILLLDFNLTFL